MPAKLAVLGVSYGSSAGWCFQTQHGIPCASDNATTEVECTEMHHGIVSKAPPGGNIGFDVKNMFVKAFPCGDVAGGTKMTRKWKQLASWLAQGSS